VTETAPCDHVQAVGSLEEELRGIEAAWINAEFEALIAENWNSEPPRPPEPPVCLPGRWLNEEHAARAGSPRPPRPQQVASRSRGRQRSPPRCKSFVGWWRRIWPAAHLG
jgi:hypothetical protein